jgi:hypothetical protein
VAEARHEIDLEELAREELTNEEVREILERLSVAEFAGGDHPTLRDVSEATGVDLLAVGKILREIRQENLGELFGDRLDEHGQRLDEHAADLRWLKYNASTGPVVEERRTTSEFVSDRKVTTTVGLVCAALLGLGLVGTLTQRDPSRVASPTHAQQGRSVSTRMENGASYYVNEKFEEWVELPNGKRRTPTAQERERYQLMLMSSIAKPATKPR